MLRNVLILGGGSAGLIAALSLKRKIPQLSIRVVRSSEIGVIGVGEGTTPNFPRHLFGYLGINQRTFYSMAQPTWKLGIRYLWGPRELFYYGFGQQLDVQWEDLPLPNGYYCEDDFMFVDIVTSLMAHGKVALTDANGGPIFAPWHTFHIENKKLVETLECGARQAGVEFIDATVKGAERGPLGMNGGNGEDGGHGNTSGITAIILEDGQRLTADFYIDASGFRSELLGKTLHTPFVPFTKYLFCDRAVVGGWQRTDEPILPYTTAETMDAGWAWQIEHEHIINRGYVYSSSFISDDDAKSEFLRKNPKVPESARVVKFRSGRFENGWVDNVLAVGNSCGFVEPLEATALMCVCWQCQTFIDMILHTRLNPTPSVRRLYNESVAATWDEIRDFLAIHYLFNTQLDTPFWRHCREDTDVSGVKDLLQFYEENGPSGFGRYMIRNTGSQFGMDGFLAMLVGNRVPYRGRHCPTQSEWDTWNRHRSQIVATARTGIDVKQALDTIRSPQWQWNDE